VRVGGDEVVDIEGYGGVRETCTLWNRLRRHLVRHLRVACCDVELDGQFLGLCVEYSSVQYCRYGSLVIRGG
jgi:hypothetical protein